MIDDLTPVQKVENYYVKRDDLFEIYGVKGGKARSCYQLILDGISKGYKTFVTAGSRKSPQCELVSTICENLNVKCILFMPTGEETSVIKNINKNKNSTIIRTPCGYNNVIISRAKKYAEQNSYTYYIPFGMEFRQNIDITKHQVKNIPPEVKRVVVPVGSGMSFCSIAIGLIENKRTDIEMVGVRVGKDPKKIIDKYLGFYLQYLKKKGLCFNIKMLQSKYKYDNEVSAKIGDIVLDPIYEAKCKEFLQDGDLLWCVGKRKKGANKND